MNRHHVEEKPLRRIMALLAEHDLSDNDHVVNTDLKLALGIADLWSHVTSLAALYKDNRGVYYDDSVQSVSVHGSMSSMSIRSSKAKSNARRVP